MIPSTFECHSGIEPPGEFVRREWRAIVTCASVFIAVLLVAIFSVDPAYYYPRLKTDQLLYYLKGLSFVQHGTTAARAAVNTEPFAYAAGPGLLRAPWMFLFRDFDDQLRAIQVSNVAIASLVGMMSAYVVSWVLPRRAHPLAVAFSFATLILSPVWVTNVLSPLADLPYAAASLGALIILVRMLCGSQREREAPALKLSFAVLFALAFAFRFTAPVLLVYGWVLLADRRRRTGAGLAISRRTLAILSGAFVLLIAVNLPTMVFGMWISRVRLRPEIAYVAVPLPVLLAMIPSTARYLLSYQPIFWMFMYVGAAGLVAHIAPRVQWRREFTVATAAIAAVLAGGALYVRSDRLTHGDGVSLATFSVGETRRHAGKVAITYRRLRQFLESVRKDSSLVIGDRAATGQWKVIAGIDHFQLDSGVARAAQRRNVYLVTSCPTRAICIDFDGSVRRAKEKVLRFAPVEFDSVFATGNDYAAARVYRLRPPR